MNKFICLLMAALLSHYGVWAHAANDVECMGRVTGQVVDDEGTPVEGASVFIIGDTINQMTIASTITEPDGRFVIESPCGNRVLGVSCFGYSMAKFPVVLNDGETKDVGTCRLELHTREMQTVIVKGHPVRVKSLADGFSVNVSGMTADSNNALDLLGRLPHISVKGNEIKVTGKEQILLQVNNVVQRVSKEHLADVLRGYDASLINTVDVITSPPLKYDAQGTTAMIVLHMDSKFNKYAGGNVGVELMKGTRYNGRYGIYGSGVYNNNKLFVDITPSYNHNYSYMSEKSIFSFVDGTSYTNHTPSEGVFDYYGSYITIQYQYNKKGYVGVNSNIGKRDTENKFLSSEDRYDRLISNQNRININRPRINASVYAEHSFNQRFKGWLEVAGYTYREHTDLSLDSYDDLSENPYMTYLSDQKLKMYGATFSNDYALKLDRESKYNLDFGVRAYYAWTRNHRWDEQAEEEEVTQSQNDYIKVNEFKFNPYVSVTLRPIQSLYFRLGAQVSHTDRNVHSREMDNHPIRYTHFLPDFMGSWSKGGSRLSFILTSGSTEPKFDQINPFEWRINQYTYAKGNLELESESRYNYKFIYTYKGSLSVSAQINQKRNEIASLNFVDNGNVYTVMTNAQNTTEYQIRPSYYYDRLNWMELMAEAYWGYGVSKGIIPGISKKATGNLWGGNLYAGFVFNRQRTFNGYINLDYIGRQQSALAVIDPIFDLGVGLSLYLLNRKMNVSLSGLNLVSSRYRGKSTREGYTINFNNKYNYPSVYLSLTYKFNNLRDNTPRHKKMMQNIDRRM